MVRLIKHHTGSHYEICIYEVWTWEAFELLAKILQVHFDATLIKKLDGPYSRFWDFNINDNYFELMHDDHDGNYLRQPVNTENNYIFLNHLADKLLQYLFDNYPSLKEDE